MLALVFIFFAPAAHFSPKRVRLTNWNPYQKHLVHDIMTSVVIIIRTPPLFQMLPKQGGVSYLPKISAPSAPILAYLYRKYTPKTSFLSFLAPQAKMLSIFARFLSDFAVRNDDFQRENSNPSQIFRSVQISESAKTRGGFLIKGGFSYYNYH